MSQKEAIAIKPLSRFVEHFDMMPPTELLDIIGEDDQQKVNAIESSRSTTKQPTPLYGLSGSNKRESSNSVNYSEQPLGNSPISPTRTNYLDRRDSSPIATVENASMPPIISQTSNNSFHSSHSSQSERNKSSNEGANASEVNTKKISLMTTIAMNNSLSNIAQQHKQNQQDPLFSPSTSGTKMKLGVKPSLNRAEFIIRRYESWNRFIALFISWIQEISKQSIQAEKAFQASTKESKFFSRKGSTNKNNGMEGFTADLASEEQKIGQHLQTEQIPILEKFRKECILIIKNLKSRPDLSQEEFWKRAEVTAGLISQLTKTCKEARRSIEKGVPIVNDPWLVNLYVLRTLRGEVNEENRLRRLMVPLQQSMRMFEERLFKAVEDALKVCLNKPVALGDAQLSKIQSSLNQAITNNWATFAAMNSKDIVNERDPTKQYLNIKYACKNDPLVMTVYKGQLERRTGVLNSKYTQRFFVITKSGFLHQFKLNDQVSPELSIYLTKHTVVPCMDISDLNRFTDHQEEQAPKDGYTFEIQRSGSVLQRDKSYVFRAVSFEDMVTWCRFISEVATQSPEATLRPVFISPIQSSNTVATNNSSPVSMEPYHPLQHEFQRRSVSPLQSSNDVVASNSIQFSINPYHLPENEHERQPVSPQKEPVSPQTGPASPQLYTDKQVHQTQLQESTPPPSPTHKNDISNSIENVAFETRRVSEDSSSFHSFEYVTNEKPKLYTPQLNI